LNLVTIRGLTPFFHQLDQIGGQLVGFAAGGAVADGDQVDTMLLAQLAQGVQ
jgi:hypothetical protein